MGTFEVIESQCPGQGFQYLVGHSLLAALFEAAVVVGAQSGEHR